MKCLDCEREMETGTVEGIGQGMGHWYEFTSETEKRKKGILVSFTRNTISVDPVNLEMPAWYCPNCKKILMWMNSKE